ncbi:acylphosphatase-2 isoform X3 [Cinclus cinclus]|uniref:acylphosphatase-2 isoform X3 n=1 Tax=Cinclus cinclus TaxID=127875 RepID=UPI002E0E4C28
MSSLAKASGALRSVDYEVFGRVQGVCFRMYTEQEAKKLGVVGWVKNTSQGTVTGQVQGPEEKVNEMSEFPGFWLWCKQCYCLHCLEKLRMCYWARWVTLLSLVKAALMLPSPLGNTVCASCG